MRLIVSVSHTSTYPDPIEFSRGDVLALGKEDDEYPGWIWTTVASGNAGWAPLSRIRLQNSKQGQATADYCARELNTRVGQRVTCMQELCDWLWVESDTGETGWIPRHTAEAIA